MVTGWRSWRMRTADRRAWAVGRWRDGGRRRACGVALAGALAGVAGCGGGGVRADLGAGAGIAPPAGPAAVAEAFLAAAGRRDHAAMAELFGTADGPIGEQGSAFGCGVRRVGSWLGLGERCLTAGEIERRMDLMARLLAHESRRVGAESAVVGLGRPAARVEVEMDVGGGVVVVPFVAILTDDGRWLVEEVGLGGLVGSQGAEARSCIRCP